MYVLTGERLEKPTYRILRQINEGAIGDCFLGYHELFHRDIVQKTVSLVGVDDAQAFTEPALLKGLNHKHLTEVWEAQFTPGISDALKAVTFVMPFYEGGSVHSVLSGGYRFSIGEAIGITYGVLDALHYLHIEHQLLHRDVKPGNVMLDVTLTHPYLGDLGSAAPMTAAGDSAAHGGSPLYRAPESRSGRYTVRSDLYGAGVLLLECLNGPLPYAELDSDPRAQSRLERGLPLVPPKWLRSGPHVPPNLARFLNKMINRDPDRRPASALAAMRELQNIKHMDWRETGDPSTRTWEGRWSPVQSNAGQRFYEIAATPIPAGRYAGLLHLKAYWRYEMASSWRQIRSVERRIKPGDSRGLAQAFREVEQVAARVQR